MKIERIKPDEVLVRFDSNPSAAMAQAWSEEIKSYLTGDEKLARVDLTELEIVSSLGVSVVVAIYRNMERQGGTITVDVPNESMLRVFELFGLTKLFETRVAPPTSC